jgi:parallel beta-helix repeat protein
VKDLNLTNNSPNVLLAYTRDSTIENVNASNTRGGGSYNSGIQLYSSSDNVLINNVLLNNEYGIYLTGGTNNKVTGNFVSSNDCGIYLALTCNNSIYHNNFVNNTFQVRVEWSINTWDDGYPSGGNYWSNYTGVDLHSGFNQDETGSDGIGDGAHEIDADNRDRYPLMAPYSTFDAGVWNGIACNVDVVSNSTVSTFQLNLAEKTVSFNVTGVEGLAGFCKVTVPNIIVQDLWQKNYTVLLNGEPWPFRNWTDATNTYIYINYTHSEHEITIIPEFPSTIILPLFTLTTLIATILLKKKRKTKPQLP